VVGCIVSGPPPAGDIDGENDDDTPHEDADPILANDPVEEIPYPNNHKKNENISVHVAIPVRCLYGGAGTEREK
jgi:hypothetical protein